MRLKKYLDKHHISKATFAAEIGVSYQTIKNWTDVPPFRSISPENKKKVEEATNGKVKYKDWEPET